MTQPKFDQNGPLIKAAEPQNKYLQPNIVYRYYVYERKLLLFMTKLVLSFKESMFMKTNR